MLYALFLLFCAVYATSGPLTKNQALEAVFGTSDPKELQSMTNHPQQWWDKRKAQLFAKGRLQSHTEFMNLFTRQTKQRCQDLIKQLGPCQKWFCNLEAFEEHLAKSSSDDPIFLTASYYATLCDHLLHLTSDGTKGEKHSTFQSLKDFRESISIPPRPDKVVRDDRALRDFMHSHMLWSFSKNGLFSMIDYLIVFSEDFHLGSAHENVLDRDNFYAHAGAFQHHLGALTHDVAHTRLAHNTCDRFTQHKLSIGSYLRAIFFTKKHLSTKALGQKILITFINIHELAPQETAPLTENLFPKISFTDPDIKDVIPFFLYAKTDQIPDKAKDTKPEDMLQALHDWREKYLRSINKLYISRAHGTVSQRLKQ